MPELKTVINNSLLFLCRDENIFLYYQHTKILVNIKDRADMPYIISIRDSNIRIKWRDENTCYMELRTHKAHYIDQNHFFFDSSLSNSSSSSFCLEDSLVGICTDTLTK